MAELNTQFPAWLAQRQWYNRENRAGQEFLQGAQVGAQISTRQREADYRDRALQLERDAFQLKRDTQLQNSEGMVALGKTLSEIANTGDWASPEAEAKFWDTVTRYPAVTHSTNFDNLAGIFERAKHAKLQRDLALDRSNKGFAPGELEKDLTYYQELLANSDTPPEILSLAQARLQSKSQGSGVTMKFGPGGTVEEVIYGKTGAATGGITGAFQTQLQQQLHAYDNSMKLLDHVEKNMGASDFGFRGMAKELASRFGGQLGFDMPPEEMDVRNTLKRLRSQIVKALRSDGNIGVQERKDLLSMVPGAEMFDVAESLPNAVSQLLTLKRELRDESRSAARRLGVSPPLWTMTEGEVKSQFGNMNANDIKAQVQAGKLSEDEAVDIIQQLNIPLFSLPTDQGPAPMIE